MNITTFLRTKGAVTVLLMLLGRSTRAAYYMAMRSRPVVSVERMMLPAMSTRSLFSRDFTQVINDFDEILNSVSKMNEFEDTFYDALDLPRRMLMNRPSLLLPRALSKENTIDLQLPRQTYEVTQDETCIELKLDIPDIDPNNVDIFFDNEKRLLKISGKSKMEENGISVHSSFERTFSMNRDVDTSKISAEMKNGLLKITAPKLINEERVRRINIMDPISQDDIESEETRRSLAPHDPTSTEPDASDSTEDTVIDLDVN